MGICTIFIFAISVFALVGGSIPFFNDYLGCNTKYNGLLSAYSAIDSYLIQADTYFCSRECPCYFNSTAYNNFANDNVAAPFFNQYYKTSVEYRNPYNFTLCSDQVQKITYDNYIRTNAYSNYTFDYKLFAQYWGHVERWFSCSGFCVTVYFNELTQTNSMMKKYVFSDVNRGVPTNYGCLQSMLDWLLPNLNAFGSIGIIVTSLLGFVIYLAFGLICANKNNKGDELKQVRLQTEAEHIKETEKNQLGNEVQMVEVAKKDSESNY